MLAWNEMSCDPRFWVPGRVMVIPWPDEMGNFGKYKVSNSVGACFTEWRNSTTEEAQLKLLAEAWHIVCRDGVDPENMHNALLVIPEYRDLLSGESFFAAFRCKPRCAIEVDEI